SAEDRIASTICPACTTRIPNDSRHCKACGVELRTAAVPPLPADGKCPRCEGRLRVHLLEDAELIECADEGGCGGVWCSRETFDRLQSRAETGGSGPEVEPPGLLPTGPSNGRAYVPCITCGNLMQRRQFRYGGRASGIVLDVCRDHGVWFDRDELQAALTVVRRSRRAVSTSGPATSGEAASGKPAHRTSVEPFPSTGGSGWILGDLGDLFELVLESIRDLNPFD
ncbi:MAG: zinc ribbon domain-containing protein, partial [Planctomycetota bacterium]